MTFSYHSFHTTNMYSKSAKFGENVRKITKTCIFFCPCFRIVFRCFDFLVKQRELLFFVFIVLSGMIITVTIGLKRSRLCRDLSITFCLLLSFLFNALVTVMRQQLSVVILIVDQSKLSVSVEEKANNQKSEPKDRSPSMTGQQGFELRQSD